MFANDSNEVDLSQFSKIMAEIGRMNDISMNESDIKTFFELCDSDGNGRLDCDEFVIALEHWNGRAILLDALCSLSKLGEL